jgi:hypothetical protein
MHIKPSGMGTIPNVREASHFSLSAIIMSFVFAREKSGTVMTFSILGNIDKPPSELG